MGNKKRKNTTSFLAQGTILAAASLISRVIGLIYRMPLTAIIGDTGNDYYGSAYTIYNILLIISSYSSRYPNLSRQISHRAEGAMSTAS